MNLNDYIKSTKTPFYHSDNYKSIEQLLNLLERIPDISSVDCVPGYDPVNGECGFCISYMEDNDEKKLYNLAEIC